MASKRVELRSICPTPKRISMKGQNVIKKGKSIQVFVSTQDFSDVTLKTTLEILKKIPFETFDITHSAEDHKEDEFYLKIENISENDDTSIMGEYKLDLSSDCILLSAADLSGLKYGVCTLIQIFNAAFMNQKNGGLEIAECTIRDSPSFPTRAVMLDISRDRVPTMENLLRFVDLLHMLKINQFQLYTEHTFQYSNYPLVWEGLSPMTPQEIKELDAYCSDRGIDLVPNQNSLSHMHRWVSKYPELALDPSQATSSQAGHTNTYDHMGHGGWSLAITSPKTEEFLKEIYGELLPLFSSGLVNVGLDEPFDLYGRDYGSKSVMQVYVEHLNKVHALTQHHGKRMMMWSDVVLGAVMSFHGSKDIMRAVPDDVILLPWSYEGDVFGRLAAAASASGHDYYVCPSTNTWNSFGGRLQTGIDNLCSAAREGMKVRDGGKCIGFLNTIWGDNGHMQPLVVEYFPVSFGAAVSWNHHLCSESQTRMESNLSEFLNINVYCDRSGVLNSSVLDLGMAYLSPYEEFPIIPGGTSLLFGLLVFNGEYPRGILNFKKFELGQGHPLTSTREMITQAKEKIAQCDLDRTDSQLIIEEFLWVADIMTFSCDFGIELLRMIQRVQTLRVSKGSLLPPVQATASESISVKAIDIETRSLLSKSLEDLISRFSTSWHSWSRDGGFKDSVARLDKLLQLLQFQEK